MEESKINSLFIIEKHIKVSYLYRASVSTVLKILKRDFRLTTKQAEKTLLAFHRKYPELVEWKK